MNEASNPLYMTHSPGDGAKLRVRRTGLDLFAGIEAIVGEKTILTAHLLSEVTEQITLRRKELGMTKREFADKMGVSARTVKRWEDGACDFKLSTLAHLMYEIGVPDLQSLVRTEEDE